MATVTDPTNLSTSDVIINETSTPPTIQIVSGTNITAAGATGGVSMQALYSWLKEQWKSDASLIPYPFPLEAITPEKFDWINNWQPHDATTRGLIRSAGWQEKNASNAITAKYMNVTSLGVISAGAQPYYQFDSGSPQNFIYSDEVNEAVKIYEDVNGDGSPDFDYTGGSTSFKVFCREQGQTYASSNNTAIGAATLDYISYRYPLSNATDLKITNNDAYITASVSITAGTETSGTAQITATAHGFANGDYVSITGATPSGYNYEGTVTVVDVNTIEYSVTPGTGAWSSGGTVQSIHSLITVEYFGTNQTRDINEDAVNENYRYVITDASSNATVSQIYEKMQYLMRSSGDIDSGAGSVTGKTADVLVYFVGDTLNGLAGTVIDSLNANQYPNISYLEFGTTTPAILYPTIASGQIVFGPNATASDTIYRMYFRNLATGSYGTASGVTVGPVDDKDGVDISGLYSGSNVNWSFAYTSNSQGSRVGDGSDGDQDVTVIAIGLDGGQWTKVDYKITSATGQVISVNPAQERNYSNP